MDEAMRTWIACLLAVACFSSLHAHHPDRESKPVHRRIDLIGPIGNRLPMSYRRRYNRPTNWGGKIAYYIAPTSQEAMRWHKATHQGQYKRHAPRMMANYFYPKPWEAIRIGARPNRDLNREGQQEPEAETGDSGLEYEGLEYEGIEVSPEAQGSEGTSADELALEAVETDDVNRDTAAE
jgi:hypothetical protein